jgi:hypothetical protein
MSNSSAQSAKKDVKETAKAEMKAAKPGTTESTYFVMAPHTKESCMKVLDELKAKGEGNLSKYKFGCMAGDHTSYAFLKAPSEEALRKMLPEDVLANAKIQKVDAITVKQIEEFHKQMK